MNNLASNSDNFKVSEYIELLIPSDIPSRRKEKKYVCPNCGEHQLSINKDGLRYDCYSCHDKSAIAKILYRLKHGETEKKIVKPKSTRRWTYTHEGKPYIQVRRIDDGTGKKDIYQYRYENKKWFSGLGDNNAFLQSSCDLLYINEVNRAIASKSKELIFAVRGV